MTQHQKGKKSQHIHKHTLGVTYEREAHLHLHHCLLCVGSCGGCWYGFAATEKKSTALLHLILPDKVTISKGELNTKVFYKLRLAFWSNGLFLCSCITSEACQSGEESVKRCVPTDLWQFWRFGDFTADTTSVSSNTKWNVQYIVSPSNIFLGDLHSQRWYFQHPPAHTWMLFLYSY